MAAPMIFPSSVHSPMEELLLEKKGRPFQYASFFLRTDIWTQWPEWRVKYSVGDTPTAMIAAMHGKIRFMADAMCVYRWRAPDSWTSKLDDSEHKAKEFEKMIASVERFNEATEGRYDDIVKKRVLMLRYNIALTRRDYKAIRSGELNDIYKSRSFLQRGKDFCLCRCPALYRIINRFLSR